MTPAQIALAALRERWAPLRLPGVAPIYWVSDLGRVAQVDPRPHPNGRGLAIKPLRLEVRPRRRPHTRVNLRLSALRVTASGARRGWATYRVHVLVAAAWLPVLDAAGSGARLVRHRNGDGTDNRLENLTRGSAGANLRDQYAHGHRTTEDARRAAHARWSEPIYTPPPAGAPIPF